MTQERVLIVDGDIALSEMLKTQLEARGYLVDCVAHGSKVLDILKNKWVDLIVLSIVLQGAMDGFKLFKEIKKKKIFSKIPIVVQSSKAAMKKPFEMMGAEAFLIKPYPSELFLDEIEDILTKKILVLGSDKSVTEAIAQKLKPYNLRVDILDKVNKFYANITLYRYCLVMLQYKVHPNTADRLVSVVRGSTKNGDIPIVIYLTKKITNMDASETAKFQLLKQRCRSLGTCDFMEKGYSNKQFLELAKKYLDIV